MQPKCRAGGTYCCSQEPASGREWMLGIPERNGGNGFLTQTCRANLFSALSEIFKGGQLKGWQPHFQPLLLKAQSRQLFIGLQQSHRSTISIVQFLETTTP